MVQRTAVDTYKQKFKIKCDLTLKFLKDKVRTDRYLNFTYFRRSVIYMWDQDYDTQLCRTKTLFRKQTSSRAVVTDTFIPSLEKTKIKTETEKNSKQTSL